MRDLSALRNKMAKVSETIASPPPHHNIRVPSSLKEELKVQGAKFSKELGWHYLSHQPDEHPLGAYRVGNGRWVEVLNIPYELRDDLKEYGVAIEKGADDKWRNFVVATNTQLLELLVEFENLNIKMVIEE